MSNMDPMPEALPIDHDDDLFTVDEFYDLIPDGQKADLLDGVIYIASPDTRRSDDLNRFMLTVMTNIAKARDLGHISCSRYAFRLNEHLAPEPDVAFVGRDRVSSTITEREGIGPPDVAVEIVARDSRSRDYNEKKKLYESSGVTEYWLLDPLVSRAYFHRLIGGRYVLVPLEGGRIFRSQAMPGFWLDVEWLFPRAANDWNCTQEILATFDDG